MLAGRRLDRWALAGLAVLALLARRDLILAPPTDFIDTVDYTRYFAWLHEYVGERLRAGHLPLWNPYTYAGLPLAANPQVAVFYPPTWLHTVLPVALAHRLTVVLHTLAAGVFAFLYFRRLRLDVAPSVVGAMPWMLGSYLTAHAVIGHLSMISTAVWIPLILYFYEGAAESGRRSEYVLAGAALGAQILAGEPQSTYYTLVILAVYGAMRLDGRRAVVPWLASVAGVVGVALLVAAVQVLPTVEMLPHSDRRTTTLAFATSGSFPPSSLAGLLLPWSLSTRMLVAGDPPRNIAVFPWEFALYPGMLTLVLALAALGRRRPPPLLAAHVLLVAGLALMLGRHTPLYELLLTAMPGLRLFRFPSRAIVIVVWSLCVLAAYGLQFVIQERPLPWRGRWRTAAVAMVAALGAAWVAASLGGMHRRTPAAVVPITLTDAYGLRLLFWLGLAGAFVVALPRLRPRAASAGAVALLAADLVLSQPPFPLNSDHAPRRALVGGLSAVREGVPGELFRMDLAARHVDALATIAARVENVNGYWPLALRRFYRYVHVMRGQEHRNTLARHQLDDALYERSDPFEVPLLNVLFATRTLGPGNTELARAGRFFPRAWVVGEGGRGAERRSGAGPPARPRVRRPIGGGAGRAAGGRSPRRPAARERGRASHRRRRAGNRHRHVRTRLSRSERAALPRLACDRRRPARAPAARRLRAHRASLARGPSPRALPVRPPERAAGAAGFRGVAGMRPWNGRAQPPRRRGWRSIRWTHQIK